MTMVERYKKWFELKGMDFEILWMNGSWTVSAWPRDTENMAYGWSGRRDTLEEAIHACYASSKESMDAWTVEKYIEHERAEGALS